MNTPPSLFLSHGPPTVLEEKTPAHDFLAGLCGSIPRPKAILVVSAHWLTEVPTVSSAAAPETIYDFYGFPENLYGAVYPAPGDPDLASALMGRLKGAGFSARVDHKRGFDHGTWVPLKLIYPKADIPVIQLSVSPGQNPTWHLALGEHLRPLRDEGVLIIGSGGLTHNLHEYVRSPKNNPTPDWVADFTRWVYAAIIEGRSRDLSGYRERAPHGDLNHPTLDHLLPLFVALGASGGKGRRVHHSYDRGVLAMDAYRFD